MQALRKTASVLLFPTLACLGVACERAGLPTEPQSATGVAPSHGLSSVSGTTRWVNDNGVPVAPGTSCDNPGYSSIQSAVTAAGPGDRINVCPGTYAEQVSIGTGDIQLRSTKRWEAVIQAPALMTPGPGGTFTIVRITSAQNVTLLAFTISGPGPTGCGSLHYGVRVDGGGSANILGNHITHIRDNPLSGCQNGVAVQVGRTADGTTGSAQIMGNVIDDYQKNGTTIDNTGSSAEIAHNRVFGAGPTALIAQNGIQVSRGATANIRHNFVAQNIYTPQTVVSTGVLLFSSGNVTTEHNTVPANDVGIYMFQAGSASMTTKNHVRASSFDGVIVDATNGAQVADNKTERNSGPGIGVYDGAQSNTLDDNHVSDNADSGILLDVASNNAVSNNKVKDNGTENGDLTDGIRINASSSGNTISENKLKHNVTHDCHDNSVGTGTAGTANTWTDNRGQTSSPSGLCDDDDDDTDFATTSAYGWDPSYNWATDFGDAADFDWVTAYATIDTDSLLQLLPSIRVGAVHAATLSPAP